VRQGLSFALFFCLSVCLNVGWIAQKLKKNYEWHFDDIVRKSWTVNYSISVAIRSLMWIMDQNLGFFAITK